MKKLLVTIGILGVLLGAISSAFAQTAKASTAGNAVLLCVEWSGHCRRVLPSWSQFIKQTNAAGYSVKNTIIDCDQNLDLCRKYGAAGYPSIYFEKSDGTILEYFGPRDAASLSKSMVIFLSRP